MRPTPSVALLLSGLFASGHVRMFCDTNDCLPVRNALSRDGDGRLSVAGPCGGAANWGANGFGTVKNGNSVSGRIQYNGGHRSASNQFTYRMACGSPSEATMRDVAPMTAANCVTSGGCNGAYPCPSPNGNAVTEGYTLSCKVEVAGMTANDKRKCTVSIVDQRNWGGCLDFELEEVPPPTPVVGMKDSSGMYMLEAGRDAYTAGCDLCRMVGGQFEVKQSVVGDNMTVTSSFVNGTCPDGTTFSDPSQTTAMVRADGQNTFRANMTIKDQKFEIAVLDSLLTLTNVDIADPTTCDIYVGRGWVPGGGEGKSEGAVDITVADVIIGFFVFLSVGSVVFAVYKWHGYRKENSRNTEHMGVAQTEPPPVASVSV